MYEIKVNIIEIKNNPKFYLFFSTNKHVHSIFAYVNGTINAYTVEIISDHASAPLEL